MLTQPLFSFRLAATLPRELYRFIFV